MKSTFLKFSTSELDAFAWQVICEWPKHSQVEVVRKNSDFDTADPPVLVNKVVASGVFDVVVNIPVSSDKSYGSFGGTIYRKINTTQRR